MPGAMTAIIYSQNNHQLCAGKEIRPKIYWKKEYSIFVHKYVNVNDTTHK